MTEEHSSRRTASSIILDSDTYDGPGWTGPEEAPKGKDWVKKDNPLPTFQGQVQPKDQVL